MEISLFGVFLPSLVSVQTASTNSQPNTAPTGGSATNGFCAGENISDDVIIPKSTMESLRACHYYAILCHQHIRHDDVIFVFLLAAVGLACNTLVSRLAYIKKKQGAAATWLSIITVRRPPFFFGFPTVIWV